MEDVKETTITLKVKQIVKLPALLIIQVNLNSFKNILN